LIALAMAASSSVKIVCGFFPDITFKNVLNSKIKLSVVSS
jgi:hypothetical protein